MAVDVQMVKTQPGHISRGPLYLLVLKPEFLSEPAGRKASAQTALLSVNEPFKSYPSASPARFAKKSDAETGRSTPGRSVPVSLDQHLPPPALIAFQRLSGIGNPKLIP